MGVDSQSSILHPPAHLSRDQRGVWEYWSRVLGRYEVVTRANLVLFASLVDHYCLYQALERMRARREVPDRDYDFVRRLADDQHRAVSAILDRGFGLRGSLNQYFDVRSVNPPAPNNDRADPRGPVARSSSTEPTRKEAPMARPPANAPPRYDGKALTKLPPAPRGMSKAQIAIYLEYGTLMVRAGMLGATDVMLLESAARVRAKLDQLYARPDGKEYVIAELEQLHLRHLVKLGLTPASRGQKKLEAPPDGEERRLKALL